MGTSNGDLIQSIADNWQSENWKIYAYTLLCTSTTTQMPVQSEGDNAQEGDKIAMHYNSDDASGNYTCIVSINGHQVFTLLTK